MRTIQVTKVQDRLNALKMKLEQHLSETETNLRADLDGDMQYVVFLSVGNPDIRARVVKASADNFMTAWNRVQRSFLTLVTKKYIDPQWIKVDLVSHMTKWEYGSFQEYLATVKKNYFRKGIAFDRDFRIAFLEQELNGYAMIRANEDDRQELDEKNINNYLNYNYSDAPIFVERFYHNRSIYTFETIGYIDDAGEVFELYRGELTNGIRKVERLDLELQQLIHKSTNYLVSQIHADGKFNYGYFPCFAKDIGTYNILRHASTLYAMAEGYEVLRDEAILQAINRGIGFLIDNAIVYRDNQAYVVDHANHREIKAGSNAHAILALTKLMQVTGDHRYIDLARALGRGLLSMQQADGSFQHVWEYPSFALKDAFRTIYYEGEAVFSLLRLYDLDRQTCWMDAVKLSFQHLIRNDYWQYHDHWLSYAANEITNYAPEDEYFIFGLKNCQNKLSFIYDRNTTYPTFLELTMAAYKMVGKIEQLGKNHLLTHIDKDFLFRTIDKRSEYQRVGFCYPEIAMYFKEPKQVLGGFFIRHHAFRVRIDDIEHNLSGYCNYLTYRVPVLENYESLTLTNV
ncbi:hypothetical protein [Paenibacillus sp. GCM10027626]|uniref:hypothetical protein n=1 Tax=Paenibacillus sp. GCM10027626 TaxID=3273411 RepID=UPI00362E87F9